MNAKKKLTESQLVEALQDIMDMAETGAYFESSELLRERLDEIAAKARETVVNAGYEPMNESE